jgi:uncharacterized protein (TIGR03118 family)
MGRSTTVKSLLYSISFLCFLFLLPSCKKSIEQPATAEQSAPLLKAKPPHLMKDFIQENLVGNNDEYSPARIDPTLVNAWGLAFSSNGVAWISSLETSLSQVYNAITGADVRAPVNIPGPFTPTGGHSTGVVFNGGSSFVIPAPNNQAARFIFAGVDGVISAWNNAAGNNAIRVYSDVGHSVYTGLAIATTNGSSYLYAADFMGKQIDVFNSQFAPVAGFSFVDPGIPSDYAPFNVQEVAGKIFVTYAKVGAEGEEENAPGNGYVSIFNTDGSFVKRLVSKGQLNSPWGVAKAPAGFFGEDNTGKNAATEVYLIGNFGDGKINAYTADGEFLGQMRAHGNPIQIEGLWAIMFPPSTATTLDPNHLYFTAGPDDETEGLFGYLEKE